MRDPAEGIAADGTIVTGARRDRVAARYEPVLAAAAAAVPADVTLTLYGSVATGQARPGRSDVDLLTVGLPPSDAAALGAELTERFAGLCRGVEIAPMQPADLVGEEAPRYGDRVFLRHYCVRLAGPDRAEHDRLPGRRPGGPRVQRRHRDARPPLAGRPR